MTNIILTPKQTARLAKGGKVTVADFVISTKKMTYKQKFLKLRARAYYLENKLKHNQGGAK